ncbi:MAG: protein-arginine deiminase [Polyangiaceae bacterium]|nr:protein-arginine deiminase [Polyangiaceae bacterium]
MPVRIALLAWVGACSSGSRPPFADLRADVDRDGIVSGRDGADERAEDQWTSARGALVLANIDDDLGRCSGRSAIPDTEIDRCHDAENEVVDGDADRADLAALAVTAWDDAPSDARGFVRCVPAERCRLFRLDRDVPTVFGANARLDRAALRAGVALGLEATDLVRDPADWDGLLDVILRVETGGSESEDRVQFRVAPFVLNHHLQAPERVMAGDISGTPEATYRADLARAATEAGIAEPMVTLFAYINDQWTQDHFEAAWSSVPGPDGPHDMTVLLRTPHVDYFDVPSSPLRRAGRIVFESLRGPNVAGVQAFLPGGTEDQQTLNSLGNLEVVPPYEFERRAYPFGRMLIGMTDALAPDPVFLELLQAQGVQPRIALDTSWLSVGHVDETLSFVPVDSPRGWAVVVADVGLALALFEDWVAAGHGDAELFTGLSWLDLDELPGSYSATTTVSSVLDDPEVMAASDAAEVEIANQLAVLEREAGIQEAELIRVPSLHFRSVGASVAYLPDTANLVELGPGHVAVADPHGPVIDGEDGLRRAIVQAFAPRGITVHFVEDWDGYHRLNGDAHCGSNVIRARPEEQDWWKATE